MSEITAATAHAADAHATPNYMAVFYTLFAITLAEVGVTYVSMPEWILITILLSMALVKAGLVAAYFMHLKYDNTVLTVIATTPLVLIIFAIAVVSYEYTSHTPTKDASVSRAAPLHAH